MSAQSLFSSVFSCSPSSKTISKRRLRQTRSLDPALMRHYGTDAMDTTDKGDFTWNSTSGRSVGLKPVPLQSLSELERVRLQDVVFRQLLQDFDLGCQFTVPKDGQKRKMSLRRKFDSLSKEKSKDKDTLPQAFGIPLSQAISNDRIHKQRHDPAQHGEQQRRDPSEPPTLPFLHLKTTGKDVSSSNSSLSSTSETPTEAPPLTFEAVPRTHRRGGVSVDCITDLDDNQSRLLEALQLSLPVETPSNWKKHCNKKLSLNPIYRQVPRVVDSCCQHLEKYGLNTVGIFRIGSSKKRVRQLREEFDQGMEVQLDAEHSVHDVAALLKVFLRDMPDPLLTRELYTAFINTMLLEDSDQENAIQLLMYLLPPCNSDTLQRLLQFLYTVAAHSEDGVDCGGREITGNKMTALNLATIFGPNLLHKLKNSDKEFAVQSFARAEESTAIISVVQRMITAYDTLFMVPADLQNEVLISLLETDPDVVDYLLRRKVSQHSDSDPVETDRSFSQSDRRLSSDSNKALSGEVSPYDNSSPVLSERLYQGGSSPSDSHFRPVEGSSEDGPTHYTEAPDENFWGGWDDLLRTNLLALQITGFHGDTWECESCESLEGLDSCQGNSKQPSRLWQSSLGVAACRPRPPLTRCRSGPYDQRGQRQPSPQTLHSQSGATSSEDVGGRTLRPGDSASSPLKGGLRDLVGDPRISHSSPTLFTYRTGDPPSAKAPQRDPKSGCPDPEPANSTSVFNTPEAGKDKWHIWQLLSTDNTDALPETLV